MAWLLNNSLFLLLALGAGFTVFWLNRHRGKLMIETWQAVLLGLAHTVVGVGCVKLFAAMETLDFSSFGGMSLFGAVFFLPLVYWSGAKLTERKTAVVFDLFTPCMIFTLLCARINCILSGCCLGAYIPDGPGWRFPTREMEIIFYLFLIAYYWHLDGEEKVSGMAYPRYMMLYGIFRFLTEGLRSANTETMLHISHLWAAIAFLIGTAVYMELGTRKGKR